MLNNTSTSRDTLFKEAHSIVEADTRVEQFQHAFNLSGFLLQKIEKWFPFLNKVNFIADTFTLLDHTAQ